MFKLSTILAGAAVAMFSQFAVAQQYCPVAIVVPAAQAPSDPNDPRYTDQSRLQFTADPLIKQRIAAAVGSTSCGAPQSGTNQMKK